MRLTLPELQAFRTLTADGRLLMLTRVVRLVAYGCLSVVFALYLAALGLTDQQIGLVLTLTLIGDAVLSLWIAAVADRLGRRRMLMLGAGLGGLLGWLFRALASSRPSWGASSLAPICLPGCRPSPRHALQLSMTWPSTAVSVP
jgi:MFS family permease